MRNKKGKWVGKTTLGRADGKESYEEGLKKETEKAARLKIRKLGEV